MESHVLQLFCTSRELSFSEIEGLLGLRSNHVAYYLKKLVRDGLLVQKEGKYLLSAAGARLLPSLSRQVESPIPVVLLLIKSVKGFAFVRREKFPYAGYLGLPGGRLEFEESLEECVVRLGREKLAVNTELVHMNAVLRERVRSDTGIVQSFLLLLVSVKCSEPPENVTWLCLEDLDDAVIIPTDRELVVKHAKSKTAFSEKMMIESLTGSVTLEKSF